MDDAVYQRSVVMLVSAVCVFLWMMQYTNKLLLCLLFQQSFYNCHC
jgi:hypothetical protein